MNEGNIKGEKNLGGTPMRWINQIKTITGHPLENAIKL